MPGSTVSRSSSSEDIGDKLDAFGKSLSAKILSSAMLKLAPFANAPGQDLEEWLPKYEYAATGSGWDKDKMAARIGSYLAGLAQAWYTVNVKDNEAGPFDYDQIVKMMAKAFLATGYQAHLREMARRRKQGLNEGVANYIFVMQNLLERMDRDGHLDEEERVERTLDGMLSQIAAQVLPYQPKTFDELLEKSKSVEKALMKQAHDTEHAHFTSELEVPAVQDKSKEKENWSKTMELITKNFSEALEKVLKTSAQSRNDERNDRQIRNNGGFGRRGGRRAFNRDETRSVSGKPRCFNCNRVGHIAKQCRDRDGIQESQRRSRNSGDKTKPKRTEGDEVCGEVLHLRTISDNRPDMIYATVLVKDQELKAVIDCGSTVTIIREDLAESLGLESR